MTNKMWTASISAHGKTREELIANLEEGLKQLKSANKGLREATDLAYFFKIEPPKE